MFFNSLTLQYLSLFSANRTVTGNDILSLIGNSICVNNT